jgi:hypothetical protein
MKNPYRWRQIVFWFTLGIILGTLLGKLAFAQSNVDNLPNNQESGIVDSIVAPPLFIQKNAKQLAKIQKCESGGIHYTASGEVLKSRTSDFGRWQINKGWIPVAESLGYDIMTPEGNEQMMFHILSVQGLNAWVCYRK